MIYFEADSPYAGSNKTLFGYRDGAASVVASRELSDSPAENVRDGYTFDFWQPGMAGTASLTFSVPGGCDYVAIASHNAHTAASGITVATGGDALTDRITVSPIDASPIMIALADRADTTVRITFKNATADLRVAVAQCGRLMQMQQTEFTAFAPPRLSRVENRIPNTSDGGHYLGTLVTSAFLSVSPSWTHLDSDWYRTEMQPFALATAERAFFMAWRPDDFPDDVVYGWRVGEVQPKNTGPADLMSAAFDMRAVTHE